MSVWLTVGYALTRTAGAVDGPLLADDMPDWYLDLAADAMQLVRRGADYSDMITQLRGGLAGTFSQEAQDGVSPYVQGLARDLSDEGDMYWDPQEEEQQLREAAQQWVVQALNELRTFWGDRQRTGRQRRDDRSRSRTRQGDCEEGEDAAAFMETRRERSRARDDSRPPTRARADDRGRGERLSGVNPRWLHRGRDRDPGTRHGTATERPEPARRSRTCVTEEVRRLVPRAGGGTHASEAAASSAPSNTSSRPMPPERLEEAQGVDAWRFLLGIDVENFEAGHDVVAAGRPLLPDFSSAMIRETVAQYDAHDRAVMTVAFMRFLRMLMAEVMVAFERGLQVGAASDRNEVLVDVLLEDEASGDETGLMQLGKPVQTEDADEVNLMQREMANRAERWSRALIRLQKELISQTPAKQRSHVHQLRARLFNRVDVNNWSEEEDQLFALLTAMDLERPVHPVEQDEEWLQAWGQELEAFLPGMATAIHMGPGPISVEGHRGLTEEEINAMARDEEEVRREAEMEARARQKEREMIEDEEIRMLQRQAALFQAWEDWGLHEESMRASQRSRTVHTKRRCVVDLEVQGEEATGSQDRPRTWRRVMTVPEQGALTLKLRAVMVDEVSESDMATVIVDPPAVDDGREPRQSADEPQEGPHVVDNRGTEGQEHMDMDYAQFSRLYGQWEMGQLSSEAVRLQYGPDVLELMEAQYAAVRDPGGDTMDNLGVTVLRDEATRREDDVGGGSRGTQMNPDVD
ncbi:unnamed protein product, partial [Symbiodinium sp. CCMP2456]